MKYEKPEIVSLGSAAAIVKGGKGTAGDLDSNPLPNNHTTQFAYEADE